MEGFIVNKFDFYNISEAMSWIAARTFDDKHFGSAITEAELQYRLSLEERYKDEIAFVKTVIQNNPNFEALSYKDKINFVSNLIVELNTMKEEDINKSK